MGGWEVGEQWVGLPHTGEVQQLLLQPETCQL